METKTVTHKRPGEPLKVVVGEANVLMGMQRTVLINEAIIRLQAIREERSPDDPSIATRELLSAQEWAAYLVERYTWPVCKAAAVQAEGFTLATLTLEEFCQLPEAFVQKWEEVALELNPHWRLILPEEEEEEDQEEKKGEPASGSE